MSDGVISRISTRTFVQTVERAEAVLTSSGQTVFAKLDQAAAAKAAGAQLRPTILFIFGNPTAGTAIMNAAPLFAIDLPLKLLIFEAQNSDVNVVYNDMGYFAVRHGLAGGAAAMGKFQAALDAIVSQIIR